MSTSRRRARKHTIEERPQDLGRKYAGPFDESPFQDPDRFKVYPTGIRGWYRIKAVRDLSKESYMYLIRGSKVYIYKVFDKPAIVLRKKKNKKSTSSRRS